VAEVRLEVKPEVDPEVKLGNRFTLFIFAISGSLWDSILVFEVIGLKVAGSLKVNEFFPQL
jgi:hypothetical protein